MQAHARNQSVPSNVYAGMAATAAAQQLDNHSFMNGSVQNTAGMTVAGYIPPYQATLALSPTNASANGHIRTQSLPHGFSLSLRPLPPRTWGPYIPQKVYRPHTSSDRRRYVEEVTLDPPIEFWLRGGHGQRRPGIPLRDALQ